MDAVNKYGNRESNSLIIQLYYPFNQTTFTIYIKLKQIIDTW